MSFLHILGLALAIHSPLIGENLSVCTENPARVDRTTVQVFRNELKAILAVSDHGIEFESCREGAIRITLRDNPPAGETALGAARRQGARVLPDLEIYVGGIARLVETRLPGMLGRAMARVATHEISHYLYQTQDHEGEGFMRERLGAAHLIAGSNSFFRLSPPGVRK